MQDLFRKLPGVTASRVGYAGGEQGTAAYRYVKSGVTGHAESLKVEYVIQVRFPTRQLLEFLLQDPRSQHGQPPGETISAPNTGSVIFYNSPEEEKIARETIGEVEASGKWPGPVVTEVVPAMPFYDAEEDHQDYLEKYPHGYTCHFIRPRLDALACRFDGNRSTHHGHACTADKGARHRAIFFMRARLHKAGAAHIHALGNDFGDGFVRCRIKMREIADQSHIGTARRRIFGDTEQRREHAGLDIGVVSSVSYVYR